MSTSPAAQLPCTAPRPTYTLHRVQQVDAGLADVFAFFADPFNLEDLTPPWLHFRIIEARDRPVRRGSRISYRLRLHGIPFRWESVIAEYQAGWMFADRQLTGPYRHWYHRHLFHEMRHGSVIEDIVEYALPLGRLGHLAHALAVEGRLRAIFDYREARIRARFGGPAWTARFADAGRFRASA